MIAKSLDSTPYNIYLSKESAPASAANGHKFLLLWHIPAKCPIWTLEMAQAKEMTLQLSDVKLDNLRGFSIISVGILTRWLYMKTIYQ